MTVWRRLKQELIAVRDSDQELAAEGKCNVDERTHHNQMGYFECPVCSPFNSDPFEEPVYPPFFMSGYMAPLVVDELKGEEED